MPDQKPCHACELFTSLWRWSAGTDARADWLERTEAERHALCAGARSFGSEALFYYYLTDLLPDPAAAEFRAVYQSQAMRAVRQQHMLGEIGAVLDRAGIGFVPIKGAYLAQEVYPVPALRRMCDLDILIEKDRFEEALRLLKKAHWRSTRRIGGRSHAPMMFCSQVVLEPHFALPGILPGDIGNVWKYWRQNRQELPVEFHFLILVAHAWQHRWENAGKFLPDLGFLLARRPPDWDKVEALRQEFGFCRPDLLYHALPELFPPETRRNAPISPDAIRSLRRLLLEPDELAGRHMEILMHDPHRFSLHWWAQRLRGFSPVRVMDKYQSPWYRLPFCYSREIALKFAVFRQEFRAPAAPEIRRNVSDNETVSACLRSEAGR